MKFNIVQILSIVMIVIIVANIVLFVMGKINVLWFWIILGIAGAIAYFGVPKMREMVEKKK
ncbi:hypothetical protein ACFL1H_03070 [Nanoarchaeota archaeon]